MVPFWFASVVSSGVALPPGHQMLCRPNGAIVHVNALPRVAAVSQFISNRYQVPAALARQIAKVVFRVSQEHRLDPYLVLAVIAVESSFRPDVVNRYGGAYGLMQIAVRAHERRVAAVGGLRRLFLIAPNIRIGVALLAQYGAQVRSQVRHALWRYSGGEFGYARKVLRLREALQGKAQQL
ncbi:Lytic transglycosylase catalytic [mine drainage metagenome]|uniref:Lytic transglycosylase catalytic n=2 Tax=mine drainage metagenome TaxID=410659 RepID=T1DHF4_9ZZZZ